MKLILTVTAGPHQGKRFSFDGHDTFLVGRVGDAHLQLSYDDPFFSRRHFVLEVNPPRCRLMDLRSRNGTMVNGQRVAVADIKHGDAIKAGHTVFEVSVEATEPDVETTQELPELAADGAGSPNDAPCIRGYEIIKELGRGGMGVVYHALRLGDGASVALKTIIPARGVSRKQIERFLREAKVLQGLEHPNIVGFREVGNDGALLFLAMELVRGPDLGNVLADRGPMGIRAAVRVICQMLSGLSHAHSRGFVHRDIKPSNILVHADGGKKLAKLADFGLARVYEASQLSGLTLQGEIGGTPAFMAPEQVTHYRDVRPAADQFATAASLYNLLTAQYVHDLPRGVPQQMIHITTQQAVPICKRRADIPQGLAEVIHTALAHEPKARFRNVDEFRSALLPWA